MRGLYATQSTDDQITCCYDRGQGSYNLDATDTVDTSHQQEGMHACNGTLMVGIDEPNNRLLCRGKGAAPSPVSPTSPINPESRRSYALVGGDRTAWKKQVRNWLMRINDFPTSAVPGSYPAAPTRSDLSSSAVAGVVTVQRVKVSYPSAADGSTIPAYVVLPANYSKSAGSYPAVLILHGHGWDKDDSSFPQDLNGDAMHAMALMAAQNGFVALVSDNRGFGEFTPLTHGNAVGTGSLDGKWNPPYGASLGRNVVKDDLTSLSVLAAYPRVDPNRIGVWGLSLGGWRAMRVMGLDPRVKRSVISGIWLSQTCFNDPGKNDGCQTDPSFWPNGITNVARNTAGLFETSDFASLTAPNRLMAQWGQNDGNFNTTCANLANDETQQIYQVLGAASNYSRVSFANMGHEIEFYTGIRQLGGFSSTGTLDSGTTCPGNPSLHCCPAGSAMAGVNVGGNQWLCEPTTAPANEVCSTTSTTRQNMLACPSGSYMRGFNNAANAVYCCHDSTHAGYSTEIADPFPSGNATQTQSFGMHVCPSFSNSQVGAQPVLTFMSGIRVDQNKQLCVTR